ncbi:MAG TPA: hypothetical protein DEB32_10160 [Stenotrophomonas sp.]|uniref:hypothetical protein n=1 Tax=Stenotrophomonas sp. TaxID=69392 RepID=UPI000E815037|nr:hypothetical protein [Stenotrophomonas sp.]HBS63061.1 hypothetical protein [Stenotrophomonas sp.]
MAGPLPWEEYQQVPAVVPQQPPAQAAEPGPWDDYQQMPVTDLPAVNALPPDFSGVTTSIDSTASGRQADGWKSGQLRDLMFGVRSVLQGAGGLFGALGGDAINQAVVNPIARKIGVQEARPYREELGYLADRLGLPSPQNATERVYGDIGEALTGTGLTLGAGGLLNAGRSVAAAPSVRTAAADFLTAQPALQVASTVGGSAAAGGTREAGGGAGLQLAAALAGGLAPGAVPRLPTSGIVPAATGSVVRRAVRGADADAYNATLAEFAQAGVQPSVGQATGNRVAQAAETFLGSVPGSAGVIDRFAQRQAGQFGSRIDDLASSLAPGGEIVDPEMAGLAIRQGIVGPGGFKELSRAESNRLYQELDQLMPQDSRVDISNAQAALAELNQAIPGAPATSRLFQNERLGGIEGGLIDDTQGVNALLTQPGMQEQAEAYRSYLQAQARAIEQNNLRRQQLGLRGEEPVPTAEQIEENVTATLGNMVDNRLPYEALQKLRSLVGREIDNANFGSDVPRSMWRPVYAALSRDMEAAVNATGNPRAAEALQNANKYHSGYVDQLDNIDTIIGKKDGEAAFLAAISGAKDGPTRLRSVMQALPESQKKMVSSAFIRRMGRAVGNQQDDQNSVFSMNTFLTNYANTSPEARKILFNGYGPEFAKNMETIAKATSRIRDGSKVFANPSGTGGRYALIGQIAGTGSTAGTLAATGNPALAFITVASSLGGSITANGAARVMTSPKYVNWLARTAELPSGELNSQLQVLRGIAERSRDPEVVDLADAVQQQLNEEQI